MVRNIVIAGLICSGLLAMAMMDVETGMLSPDWDTISLEQKIEMVAREKRAALERFRARLRDPQRMAEAGQEADRAIKLDDLETMLRIEQSDEQIENLQALLAETRQRLSGRSRVFSSRDTDDQLKRAEREIERELDKEREKLKRLKNPNLAYE